LLSLLENKLQNLVEKKSEAQKWIQHADSLQDYVPAIHGNRTEMTNRCSLSGQHQPTEFVLMLVAWVDSVLSKSLVEGHV
jgi:hypothetical protein